MSGTTVVPRGAADLPSSRCPTKKALVEGLHYGGTLVLVSHDRWSVSQLATRILEIVPRGITDSAGGYDEYVERWGDDHLDTAQVMLRAKKERQKAKAEPDTPAERPDPKAQEERKKQEKRRDEITHEIGRAEARVNEINELFCNPGFFDKTASGEMRKLEAEQQRLTAKVEELMAEWEAVEAALG